MVKLFGFEFRKVPQVEPPSFVPPENDDGAAIVSAFNAFGTVVDLDGTVRTEAELITKYREMALQPEVDQAIEEIVTEAIVQDDNNPVVQLLLEDAPLPDNIKDILQEEFEGVLKMLNFNVQAYDIFKQYYVDGRLYYHVLVDPKAPQNGVTEVRIIDPRKIRKIKEVVKVRDKENPDLIVTKVKSEYYMYNEQGFNSKNSKSASSFSAGPSVSGLKIAKDSIVQVVSGVQDPNKQMVYSYLHKAIKPLNQLRAMEDATLIYRISRAPERRVFYIDVGNLPKAKAEQHLRDMMVKHKNKLVYDATTGETRDDRRFMTMIEDYWLPRRGDGRATEITTLPGGQNLGVLEDVEYFQKRLYRSLNVPITRLDPERAATLGRATEITRDEIKFSRFIDRMRMRFSELFLQILHKQLVLKMIIAPEEWDAIKSTIKFKFARDIFWAELKDAEILTNRLAIIAMIDPFASKYYSHTWIRKNVLKQTDEEIEQIDEEIAEEMLIPQYNQLLLPTPIGPDGIPLPPMGGGPGMPMGGGPKPAISSQKKPPPK